MHMVVSFPSKKPLKKFHHSLLVQFWAWAFECMVIKPKIMPMEMTDLQMDSHRWPLQISRRPAKPLDQLTVFTLKLWNAVIDPNKGHLRMKPHTGLYKILKGLSNKIGRARQGQQHESPITGLGPFQQFWAILHGPPPSGLQNKFPHGPILRLTPKDQLLIIKFPIPHRITAINIFPWELMLRLRMHYQLIFKINLRLRIIITTPTGPIEIQVPSKLRTQSLKNIIKPISSYPSINHSRMSIPCLKILHHHIMTVLLKALNIVYRIPKKPAIDIHHLMIVAIRYWRPSNK